MNIVKTGLIDALNANILHEAGVSGVLGRLSAAEADYDELRANYENGAEGLPSYKEFNDQERVASELLTEARALPDCPRKAACTTLLARIVDEHDDRSNSWYLFSDRIEEARERFRDAAEAKRSAYAARDAGTLDPKRAVTLEHAAMAADGAFRFHLQAATQITRLPRPPEHVMPADIRAARRATEELAKHFAEHGAVFDDNAERPALDVVAFAARQAREATETQASTWVLFEARELARIDDAQQRADLARVFAVRANVYAERAKYGEHARV
jgi:hypothetical protein